MNLRNILEEENLRADAILKCIAILEKMPEDTHVVPIVILKIHELLGLVDDNSSAIAREKYEREMLKEILEERQAIRNDERKLYTMAFKHSN